MAPPPLGYGMAVHLLLTVARNLLAGYDRLGPDSVLIHSLVVDAG